MKNGKLKKKELEELMFQKREEIKIFLKRDYEMFKIKNIDGVS